MAFLNDTYCQICEKIITKEHLNKHPSSSRHIHREVNGYWPVYFPQRKLSRDKSSILEKAIGEMIFGSEDVLPVYRFVKTYFRMDTNLNEYVEDDDGEDVDKDDFGQYYSNNMIAQFREGLYSRNFGQQDQGKAENDTLKKRIRFWLNVIVMGGPIPDFVYDYDYNVPGIDFNFRAAEIFPENRELKKLNDILKHK